MTLPAYAPALGLSPAHRVGYVLAIIDAYALEHPGWVSVVEHLVNALDAWLETSQPPIADDYPAPLAGWIASIRSHKVEVLYDFRAAGRPDGSLGWLVDLTIQIERRLRAAGSTWQAQL